MPPLDNVDSLTSTFTTTVDNFNALVPTVLAGPWGTDEILIRQIAYTQKTLGDTLTSNFINYKQHKNE